MELYAYCRGSEHSIYFLEVHKNHHVKAFLRDLGKNSKGEATALTSLMDRTAKNGIVWNPQHTRALRHSAKPTNEFKKGQARIFWFQDRHDSRNIVCTNGFRKKDDETSPNDIARAHERMNLFYRNREQLLPKQSK